MRSLPSLVVAVAVVAACGGDDDRPSFPDTGPTIPPASARPQVAFEGHGAMAIEITATGADLTGATIAPEDPSGPLSVVSSRCNGTRCGVVVAVADTRPNMGKPIPAPIDAANHFLSVTKGEDRWRALITVYPLDAISNGGTMPLTVRGVQLASSITTAAGSTFRGGDEPVRWIVFGGGSVNGTIDVSAEGAEGFAGGHAGGAPGARGSGPGAGAAAPVAGAGAGGAGGSDAGGAGEGADGTPGTGGAGGDAITTIACVDDTRDAACGGSSGGGAAGAGGAGGGTLLLASLAPLDLAGATLRAGGGDGVDGGGGGAAGMIVVAAPSITETPILDAAGGGGGASSGAGGMGGAGTDGFAVMELGTGSVAGLMTGPSVDLSTFEPVTDQPMLTLTGSAEPDAAIVLEDTDGGRLASTTADASGAWTAELTLEPGVNRIAIVATGALGTLRSWTGTNIDFVNEMGTTRPVGATVDVVYVP